MSKYKFEVIKVMNGEVVEKRTSTFDTENILAGGLSPELYLIPQKIFDSLDIENAIRYTYIVETSVNVEKLL